MMNKKELEAFAKQAAKGIKSEADLNDFRAMLTKITVEAALYKHRRNGQCRIRNWKPALNHFIVEFEVTQNLLQGQ